MHWLIKVTYVIFGHIEKGHLFYSQNLRIDGEGVNFIDDNIRRYNVTA